MPSREWSFRIEDILNSIDTIQGYTEGMTLEEFVADRKTVDAVIRQFAIIGEAACHVPEDICLAHPEIPWKEMRAMRNYIVHVYFGVKDQIIWETVQKDIPSLPPLLRKLISSPQ